MSDRVRRLIPTSPARRVVRLSAAAALAGILATALTGGPPPLTAQGDTLLSALGCGACHTGLPAPRGARAAAPPLAFAGLRYRPGYLFRFLQEPARVRPHIGAARMPAFHLDEREAVALVRYLLTRTTPPAPAPPMPVELTAGPDGRPATGDPVAGARLVRSELGCTACHAVAGSGARLAPDLAGVAERTRPGWLTRWLAAPRAFLPETPMPAVFYEAEAGALRPRIDGAARKLADVLAFLEALPADPAGGGAANGIPAGAAADSAAIVEADSATTVIAASDAAWRAARARHGDVTAEDGRRAWRALGCAGCHEPDAPLPAVAAPPLERVGDRFRPAWLRDYLRRPHARRPFGLDPGTGARMPDFRLNGAEVARIARRLGSGDAGAAPGDAAPSRRRPSAFVRARADRLLRDVLPCLGCHRLDGEGGRIGPDLTAAGARLRPEYIAAILADPAAAAPGAIMPRTPMPRHRADRIAAYLASRGGEGGETGGGDETGGFDAGAPGAEPGAAPAEGPRRGYPSVVDEPPRDRASGAGPAALYARYCAACHGVRGGGDGFNARFLPVPPTRHADSASMATRPDDTLFDGIHVGGFVLDRSHRMPGFGETLSYDEIRGLVAYLRELCGCREPGWARDGGPQ